MEDKPKFNNPIPKNIVGMEKYLDLQDKFKKPTNIEINNYSLKYEVVNLSMEQNLQNINLGTNCSPTEEKHSLNFSRSTRMSSHGPMMIWIHMIQILSNILFQ